MASPISDIVYWFNRIAFGEYHYYDFHLSLWVEGSFGNSNCVWTPDLDNRYNGSSVYVVSSMVCLDVIHDDKLSFALNIGLVVSRTNSVILRISKYDIILPWYMKWGLIHVLALPNIFYCHELYFGTASYTPFVIKFLGCTMSQISCGVISISSFYSHHAINYTSSWCAYR